MVWIPQTIKDLDNCNHLIIKYQPDVDINHPVLIFNRKILVSMFLFKVKFGNRNYP